MSHKFSKGIPESAKRVFKGVIFDVYQWEQEMFDGSTQTFEAIKRPDYAGVIPVLENKKIIVLEQEHPNSKPFFSFPGGRIDKGETAEQAAIRELREEAGLEAQKLTLWKQFQPSAKIEFDAYEFIAKNCSYVGEPSMPHEEKIIIHEFSFDKLLEFSCEYNLFRGGLSQIEFIKAKYDKEKRQELYKLFYD